MVTGIAVGSAVAIIGALANYFVSRYQVEHQVRYTHWYNEQAKVVAELYKRVVETERNLKAWAGPFGNNSQEQREAAGVSYNDLYHYYHTTSIWLNQSVCESLDSFLSEAAHLFGDFDLLSDPNPTRRAWNLPDDPQELREMRRSVYNQVLEQIPSLRTQLREAFRTLLNIANL